VQDELKDAGSADVLQHYYDKWEKEGRMIHG
jgi:hypothetical protein